MTRTFPRASPAESLLFNVVQVLPNTISGLFAKRAWLESLFNGLDTDFVAAQFLAELRGKHRSDAVWIQVLGEQSLLVFGAEALREVLEGSATVYASDPKAKLVGMSHFQPDALTISSGDKWRERRRFAEDALATEQAVHPLSAHFLAVVREEVAELKLRAKAFLLDWAEFEKMTEKVALQVILGRRARDDHALLAMLREMMLEANQVVGLKKSKYFDEFYRLLGDYVDQPGQGSLVSQLSQPRQAVLTQITHWLFAMSGTLAVNTFRTLAAVAGLPDVTVRVRAELAANPLAEVSGVDGLRYLEGCVQEAMRLWPTTTMFGRQTTRDTTLTGVAVPKGTQVVIVNAANHRFGAAVTDPDGFLPERWLTGSVDYRFNHFSNGTQRCPGSSIALFLAKAMLAHLLVDTCFVEQRAGEGAVPPSGKVGTALRIARTAANPATLPARLFTSGSRAIQLLERLTSQPEPAPPHLTELLRQVPLTMMLGERRASRGWVEPGRPMPYTLSYGSTRFAMEPVRSGAR